MPTINVAKLTAALGSNSFDKEELLRFLKKNTGASFDEVVRKVMSQTKAKPKTYRRTLLNQVGQKNTKTAQISGVTGKATGTQSGTAAETKKTAPTVVVLKVKNTAPSRTAPVTASGQITVSTGTVDLNPSENKKAVVRQPVKKVSGAPGVLPKTDLSRTTLPSAVPAILTPASHSLNPGKDIVENASQDTHPDARLKPILRSLRNSPATAETGKISTDRSAVVSVSQPLTGALKTSVEVPPANQKGPSATIRERSFPETISQNNSTPTISDPTNAKVDVKIGIPENTILKIVNEPAQSDQQTLSPDLNVKTVSVRPEMNRNAMVEAVTRTALKPSSVSNSPTTQENIFTKEIKPELNLHSNTKISQPVPSSATVATEKTETQPTSVRTAADAFMPGTATVSKAPENLPKPVFNRSMASTPAPDAAVKSPDVPTPERQTVVSSERMPIANESQPQEKISSEQMADRPSNPIVPKTTSQNFVRNDATNDYSVKVSSDRFTEPPTQGSGDAPLKSVTQRHPENSKSAMVTADRINGQEGEKDAKTDFNRDFSKEKKETGNPNPAGKTALYHQTPAGQVNIRSNAEPVRSADRNGGDQRLAGSQFIQKLGEQINLAVTSTPRMTNIAVESETVGKIEVQFSRDPDENKATIVVESEEVSGQIQKLMPSIIDNLNQKGLQFAALDVQVRNFGDNRKREKETGSANITREPNAAEPEAGLSTNNQSIRNYGYNTVEYVA